MREDGVGNYESSWGDYSADSWFTSTKITMIMMVMMVIMKSMIMMMMIDFIFYFSWTSLCICLIYRLLRTAIYTKPQQSNNKYWFLISSLICIFLTLVYFPLYLIHLEDFINFVPGWLDLIWNLGNPTARRSDTYCQWKAILKSLLKLKNFNFVQKILSRKLQTFQNTLT